MKIKQQSTGDNDSVEDAMIAICNIRTEDGKLINMKGQFDAVVEAFENIRPKPSNRISDEEIMLIWVNNAVPMNGKDFLKVARAIENKLLGE